MLNLILVVVATAWGQNFKDSTAFAVNGCCTFPTTQPPTDSYLTSPRKFGASRANGRLHSACDLYRPTAGEPIRAVDDGEVIRGPYAFYEGTYALEVKHASGFVVRYGEITGRVAPGVKVGAKITKGQTVGFMGKVNSNCCSPMLNFEMFSGAAKGSLTQPRPPYQRRSDLMNPTAYLQEWEQDTFGSHTTGLPAGNGLSGFLKETKPIIANQVNFSSSDELERVLALLINGTFSPNEVSSIVRSLEFEGHRPQSKIDSSEITGAMLVVDSEAALKTSVFIKAHVQFIADDFSSSSISYLQHFSVDLIGNMEELTKKLSNIVGALNPPEENTNGFLKWRLPNGYVLWFSELKRFHEADQNSDKNLIRVAVELEP